MDVLLNGRFMPYEQAMVPIDDRGFQFAESVYEVIHVYSGRPFAMENHMRRLAMGLEALEIDLGMTLEALAERCMELVRRNGLNDALIYIQITSGHAPRNHVRPNGLVPTVVVTTSPAPPASETWPSGGISCKTVPDERWAGAYIKTTMLLPNTAAKRRAMADGFDEAIIVRDGYAIESTSSNLFAVFGSQLWTPPASNYILGGITREVVLDLVKELGIPLVERSIPAHRLYAADELFVTASGIELVNVASVDGKQIGRGQPGPMLTRLREAFRKKTTG